MNEIDKIFKNKLENYREMPSAEAWNHIQVKLQKKNSNRKYLIAAAVALFLISSLVWMNFSFDKKEYTAGNDKPILMTHPQIQKLEMAEINFPKEVERQENLEGKMTKKSSQPQIISKPKSTKMIARNTTQLVKVEKKEITPKEEIEKLVADNKPTLNEEQKKIKELFEGDEDTKYYSKVKITYIASGKKIQKEQEQPRKADKLWKKIKDSSPLKVLADIREAKERLIQGKLKSE